MAQCVTNVLAPGRGIINIYDSNDIKALSERERERKRERGDVGRRGRNLTGNDTITLDHSLYLSLSHSHFFY